MAESDKIRCRVVGPAEVLGVAAPGEVDLDPQTYNIAALAFAGHVEVLDSAPETSTEQEPTGRRTRRAAGAVES